jgi:hypothetical protein
MILRRIPYNPACFPRGYMGCTAHLRYDKILKRRDNLIGNFVIMDIEAKHVRKVEAVDAHDGLRVHEVTARHQIEIALAIGYNVNEFLHLFK